MLNSATIRPGRADITSTRVDMNTASEMEWVMKSPAKPLGLEEPLGFLVEMLSGDLVDGAERFIEEENWRLEGQRSRERGAHLHSAGEDFG